MFEHGEQASSTGVCVCVKGGGGNRLAKWRGSNRLPGLITN